MCLHGESFCPGVNHCILGYSVQGAISVFEELYPRIQCAWEVILSRGESLYPRIQCSGSHCILGYSDRGSHSVRESLSPMILAKWAR